MTYSTHHPQMAFLLHPTPFRSAKVSVTAIPTSIIVEPILPSSFAAQLVDNHGSTTAISVVETVASSSLPRTVSFEPVLPDATLFLGMGSVIMLCIAAGYVWANDVVPVSRTKLAISKSRGGVCVMNMICDMLYTHLNG